MEVDLTAIARGREVVAEMMIDVTHVVTETPQTPMMPCVPPVETSIVAADVLAHDLGHPLTIDTIVLELEELDEMMMTVLGIVAHVGTVQQRGSEHLAPSAQRASLQHHNPQRTSVTEGLCSCSSLLLD